MTPKLLKRWAMAAAVAAPAMFATGLLAPATARAADAPDPAENVSGVVGVTFTTDYISRGLVLENEGLIAQPYGELAFKLFEGEGTVKKASFYGGVWSSLHSEHTDAEGDRPGEDSTTDIWYEFDWYLGMSFDLLDNWNFKVSYWEFISPNDGFGSSHNLEFALGFNDAGLWGDNKDFSLSPYVKVFIELEGKAGNGSDEGVYVEVGISPGLPAFGGPDYPIKVNFPMAVGLGFSDFYGDVDSDGSVDNETFGYATIGVVASVPLKFMSDAGFGAWTFSVGGNYYFLGEALEDFNVPNVKGDSESEWVAFTALSVGF